MSLRAAVARPVAPCQPHTSRQRPPSSRRPTVPVPARAKRRARLLLVGQPRDVGRDPVLLQGPQQVRAGHERLHRPRVIGRLDPPPHAQRDRRDHAQRPLGAQDQLAQRRTRRGARRVQRRQRPRRRHARQRHDLLVDPPVAGRGLPGRARRRAPADRRPLVRLRHVPQRQPLRAQRRIGLGQADPRLEHRHQRPRIDRDHAIQPAQVQGHQRREPPALPREPADDARAAPERHHGDAVLAAQPQHLGHLRLRPRRDHRVRRRSELPRPRRQQVQVRLPPRPQHPRRHVVAHLRDRLEPLPQPVRQHRGRQRHVLQRHRRADHVARHAELALQQLPRVLRERRPGPGLAPAPEDLLASHSPL